MLGSLIFLVGGTVTFTSPIGFGIGAAAMIAGAKVLADSVRR